MLYGGTWILLAYGKLAASPLSTWKQIFCEDYVPEAVLNQHSAVTSPFRCRAKLVRPGFVAKASEQTAS